MEKGEINLTDLSQSEASLAGARAELITAQNDLVTSKANFEKIIGKKVGQDVVNNKKTALHHLLVNTASEAQLSKYYDYIIINDDDEKIEKIKSLFIRSDVEKSLKKLVQEYSNNATSAIESLNPKFYKTSDLILLSEFLLKRNY